MDEKLQLQYIQTVKVGDVPSTPSRRTPVPTVPTVVVQPPTGEGDDDEFNLNDDTGIVTPLVTDSPRKDVTGSTEVMIQTIQTPQSGSLAPFESPQNKKKSKPGTDLDKVKKILDFDDNHISPNSPTTSAPFLEDTGEIGEIPTTPVSIAKPDTSTISTIAKYPCGLCEVILETAALRVEHWINDIVWLTQRLEEEGCTDNPNEKSVKTDKTSWKIAIDEAKTDEDKAKLEMLSNWGIYNQILSNSGSTLYLADFESLLPKQWLTDGVINHWLYSKMSENPNQCSVLHSTFILMNTSIRKDMAKNGKIRLGGMKFVLIPVNNRVRNDKGNFEGIHWYLIILDIEKKQVLRYSSTPDTIYGDEEDHLKIVREFFAEYFHCHFDTYIVL